jgi:hypothetical protein
VQNVNDNVNIAWNVVFVNASSLALLVKYRIALHWNFSQYLLKDNKHFRRAKVG